MFTAVFIFASVACVALFFLIGSAILAELKNKPRSVAKTKFRDMSWML
jgi:hypothetical protein